MKFENINVGDTVFVKKYVNFGWRQAKGFWIPTKVKRVTKTQFVVEESDRRFKREFGSEIKGRYLETARLENETYGYRGESKVYDQTEEMNAFAKKVMLVTNLNSQKDKLGRFHIEMSSDKLDRAKELLDELIKLSN